jgi:murein DD-endopeptidase MepM/ murein hydrolase activator NlpD
MRPQIEPAADRKAELLAQSAGSRVCCLNALAQTTLRARRPAHNRISSPALDLGVEPPIEAYGVRLRPRERRRISLRWLCGSILIGLSGAGLIAVAISAAFDRRSFLPAAPEFAIVRPETSQAPIVNPRKGDRILKPIDVVAAKHDFRAAVTVRVGDKEIVRMRAFTRVATPLTMTSLGFADRIPTFNPLRLISQPGGAPAPPPDPGPAPNDAEVSFEMKDLASFDGNLADVALSTEEAQAQVAEYGRAVAEAGGRASPSPPPELLLLQTSRLAAIDPAAGLSLSGAASAPLSSIQVRMVPENVTFIPESASDAGPAQDEQLVSVGPGESLDDVLQQVGAPQDQRSGLGQALALADGRSPIEAGEQVKLQFLDLDGASRRLARVWIYSSENLRAAAALDDAGAWEPMRTAPTPSASPLLGESDDDDRAMRLWDSLFETALKQGAPRSDVEELARIFGNDVDFQAPVVGGDAFDVLYERPDSPGGADTILYASIVSHGQTFKYYRFRTPDDNLVDYYHQDGQTTHKFLVREPVLGARLTSPFGERMHPILGYARMHTGVDWAAPIGTPIYAAGDGVVDKAGRESGYGNRVEIEHAEGYVTTYSHMSGFARGVAPGVHVAQGQVIGYLGMTGLATGPHLHYEVIVNGRFVDPLSVKLARTRELSGDVMTQFQQNRQRIDNLLAASSQPFSADEVGGEAARR